jgi:hypothetical protein
VYLAVFFPLGEEKKSLTKSIEMAPYVYGVSYLDGNITFPSRAGKQIRDDKQNIWGPYDTGKTAGFLTGQGEDGGRGIKKGRKPRASGLLKLED